MGGFTSGSDVQHEQDKKHVRPRVSDSSDKGLPVGETTTARASPVRDSVGNDSNRGQLLLVWRETRRRAGIVEQDETSHNGHPDGRGALDDEEPSPARDAMRIAQVLRDATCQDAAEGARQHGSCVEDAESLA